MKAAVMRRFGGPEGRHRRAPGRHRLADVGKLVAECVKNDNPGKQTLHMMDPERTGFTSMFGSV